MAALAVWGLVRHGRNNHAPRVSKLSPTEKKKRRVATTGLQDCTVYNCNMPALADRASSKKRKNVKEGSTSSSKRRAVEEADADAGADETMSKIAELEIQISESRKHYNNIATLLSMLGVEENAKNPNLAVAVSLCRVFSRLMAGGNMTEASRVVENEKIIVAWLKERCQEYQKALVAIMREGNASAQVCIEDS